MHIKEYFKNLRKESNITLIDKLNYNQQMYNKWFDIYKYDRYDRYINYKLDIYLNNINKIKQVFKERNIEIAFSNGWNIIKEFKKIK